MGERPGPVHPVVPESGPLGHPFSRYQNLISRTPAEACASERIVGAVARAVTRARVTRPRSAFATIACGVMARTEVPRQRRDFDAAGAPGGETVALPQ
jgi:hypothetical protein